MFRNILKRSIFTVCHPIVPETKDFKYFCEKLNLKLFPIHDLKSYNKTLFLNNNNKLFLPNIKECYPNITVVNISHEKIDYKFNINYDIINVGLLNCKDNELSQILVRDQHNSFSLDEIKHVGMKLIANHIKKENPIHISLDLIHCCNKKDIYYLIGKLDPVSMDIRGYNFNIHPVKDVISKVKPYLQAFDTHHKFEQ